MSSAPSTSKAPIPVLLPKTGVYLKSNWRPTHQNDPPQSPVVESERQVDIPLGGAPLVGPNGELMRPPKKVKPRRTIDYNGSIARWIALRKIRPNPSYKPPMRPSAAHIIDLLPPKAYPDNASTSICTKFVHTSTNKIRFPVNVVTWTPEARRVLTGSTSGEFTLWNGLTFNFETILQAHDSAIRAFEFSHSGAFLVSADQSGIVKYFQPNMNNVAAWAGHREAIRGLSFSPDDSRFATCSDDQTIKLWAFDLMREERTLTGHGWDVKCIKWHPTKGLLASGSKDNLVKFWDPRSGQPLSSLHHHKNTVQALEWNPNGDYLATASRDQTVRVFDIRAMKEFQVYKGHKKEVCSIAWHPVHHDLLVSGGAEGSLIYWLLNDPTPRATLDQAHDSNVWSMAWHPLGHLLCSASNDYTARWWCRERPGDISSDFRQGGEKPPADTDADDDNYVPGFGYVQQTSATNDRYGGDEYEESWSGAAINGAAHDVAIPGFGGGGFAPSRPPADSIAGRQGAPLPPQQEALFGGGNYGGHERDNYRDRGGNRDDYFDRGGRGGGGGGGGGGFRGRPRGRGRGFYRD